ncbi:alpha/beta hydrolase-fold protein [Sphingomonas sp. BK235]|uniref:alpha/beta hydrolase n=1 Tax=Sphingomonas sp. BK235 TaxID=2512131 RepID=UPI00104F1A4E|nr:alpha/beta hydrolase-fold protein [Sphingomonas sp. BK235]TCP31869.1 enterochelin esterase family protein [Sphingomonas sp. BK235]
MRAIFLTAALTVAALAAAAAPGARPGQQARIPSAPVTPAPVATGPVVTAPAPTPPAAVRLEGPFALASRVYPGTVRRYWVYVPPGYDPARPPNLLLFQDGQRATRPDGSLRVPAVLDALIRAGAIPPTLGVFVTPGHRSARYPDTLGMANPDHRAEEYDALSDDYSRMTLDELLPAVARRWRFAADPRRRAIAGTSSGAIASWTVAWRHPEAFGNVISFIGSYTSIGLRLGADGTPLAYGGDVYPGLIRKSPIRPLRVFLQDGRADLDNEHGHWFLANQQMLAALRWANAHADATGDRGARYDVDHVWTDGGHSDADGGALLPGVLRWIWRDQPARPRAGGAAAR